MIESEQWSALAVTHVLCMDGIQFKFQLGFLVLRIINDFPQALLINDSINHPLKFAMTSYFPPACS
jgi:hypothetical protein